MSDHREAIAEVLWEREFRIAETLWDEPAEVQQGFLEDADALLDSNVLAQIRAEARAEALREFAEWVAVNRAYNGSEHHHAQSLYNECLNAVLPKWAAEFAVKGSA